MATLPFTYADIVCDLDVDIYARETTSDLQALIQDLSHVLVEFPGTNFDDPDRGVGVEQYLGATVDQFQSLQTLIENQFNRDDRVYSTSCSIAQSDDGTFSIQIDVQVSEGVVPLEFGWQNGQFTNLTSN